MTNDPVDFIARRHAAVHAARERCAEWDLEWEWSTS